MDHISPSTEEPVGMGLTSLILGSVGTLLFFLPVLGIPLGGVGLLFGGAGLLTAILGGRSSLRWSVMGIAVSCLALGIGFAVSSPTDFRPNLKSSRPLQSTPDQHYVSPPARPGT